MRTGQYESPPLAAKETPKSCFYESKLPNEDPSSFLLAEWLTDDSYPTSHHQDGSARWPEQYALLN
ncbi:uncharacterized protein BDCG_08227 [Blastomyces dermatitidis ER-3]|uniref:Uncharacterized protein n=2 Tax=Ajellomyces dermatitidis TaxID=5039 RepID=F2T7Q5_AJEDA|nr:uncharacterized protein BDCG_08227 [Blastomyces dermatitidis ER-3]EEQ84958.2 hypothetical protein BDCG_08227 [Blastomyces dermatitidis ER-3]EGE79268.2 hypothetical protein BDDG_02207 [Blastomyces dermatitidis ATCC 18188]